MKRNLRSGQSLIEVVVAMALVVVASVALVSTTIFTQKTSRSANAQSQATKLVEESIEKMRVLRDRKGFTAIDFNQPCMALFPIPNGNDISLWQLLACSPATTPSTVDGEIITLPDSKTVFKRRISVINSTANKKEVRVTVFWEESGGTRSVISITYFSNCLTESC